MILASLGHAEQLLFSCLDSKVTAYSWKLQCFFLGHPPSHPLIHIRVHRAGSQMKRFEVQRSSDVGVTFASSWAEHPNIRKHPHIRQYTSIFERIFANIRQFSHEYSGVSRIFEYSQVFIFVFPKSIRIRQLFIFVRQKVIYSYYYIVKFKL